ncbi:MAG: beta-lactamase family protein [Candidatus Saccharicenans sp.]|nr:beta-lactamase family protein [Candidatus Saccharicenans sp.]
MFRIKTKRETDAKNLAGKFLKPLDADISKITNLVFYFFIIWLTTLTMVTLSLAAVSQVQKPGEIQRKDTGLTVTETGKRAEQFWLALEKADPDRLEAFFRENLPPEKLQQIAAKDRAQQLLGLRRQLGKELNLLKMISPSPEETILFITNQNNEMFRLSLTFEKQGEQFWLKGLAVDETGPEDLAAPLPPMNLQQALQAIEREIEQAVGEDRFSGVVLIARNFSPVFFKSYGLASKEFSAPNRPDTRFNLGSINKIFTKIAIGQLAARGQLNLDDRLGKFLPEYPNSETREKVTVRHLVNMTSGIGDFFGPEFEKTPKNLLRHNRDYLRLFAAKPLAFDPGTRQMYSNGGYVVLGEIISAVSGIDYYDYVRKFIFEPAGMKDSDWFEADSIIPNLAEGYTRQAEEMEPEKARAVEEKRNNPEMVEQAVRSTWRRNIYTRPARGSAAGGGYATAEDLLRFLSALTECRLLDEYWTHWVFTGQEPISPRNQPGILVSPTPSTLAGGKQERKVLPRKDTGTRPAPAPGQNPEKTGVIDRSSWSLGIAGGAPGINAALEFDGQTGFTIIVLSNYDPPAATQTARMIRRYLQAVTKR